MTDLSKYRETVAALEELVDFFTRNHQALNHLPSWVWEEEKGGINFEKYRPVLHAAQEEIREFERRQAALTSSQNDPLSEDYILTHSALRINGYRYRDETDLDTDGILDVFYRTGSFGTATPPDKLACFFLLQRFLCKWGGERLSKNSPEWKAYRQLFLDTARVEVPCEFRPREPCATRWEHRIHPRLDDCIAIVAAEHKKTEYAEPRLAPNRDSDDAPPRLDEGHVE